MSTAEIYQIKAVDGNRNKLFIPFSQVENINLDDYEKVATLKLKDSDKSIESILESIFTYGNTSEQFRKNNPNARSISVSDIIKLDGKYYYCDTLGFEDATNKVLSKEEESISDYMDKLSVNYIGKIFAIMRQNGWDGNKETADKFFDDIMAQLDPRNKDKDEMLREDAPIDSEDVENDVAENIKYQSDIELDRRKTDRYIKDHDLEIEEPEEAKDAYDYLEDRIGQDITIGELNTVLQSIFGKYNEIFLTYDQFYNQDPEDLQELVIWDDNDMYTITYQIKDQQNPTIEITDLDLE